MLKAAGILIVQAVALGLRFDSSWHTFSVGLGSQPHPLSMLELIGYWLVPAILSILSLNRLSGIRLLV
jgi:hypothetical protein